MTTPRDFTTRPAQAEDIPHILALACWYDLRHQPPEQAARLGFLVSRFDERDYGDFLERANYFSVLSNDTRIAGFLLSYSSDKHRRDEWLHKPLKSLSTEPYIVIRQICIQADMSGQGLATSLYHHLFRQVPDQRIVSMIVLNPPNHRSIAFHEKLGFAKVLEIDPPGKVLRGIWMREGEQ
jgi:predicted GNAT superfamily acetyltransferase